MNAQRIPLVPVDAGQITAAAPDQSIIWCLLEEVVDPEIPVLSLRDLGVLREVCCAGNEISVVLTPTYSGCPAMHAMEQAVRAALDGAGYPQARIEMRLAPAWTTDWMSDAGREKLRAYGIAPPQRTGMPADIHCPQCGSVQVRRVSEFGSTACKALYQCADCREPFDYFKCI